MVDAFEDHCWKDIVDADTLEIYKHYRRQTYIGQRPALLAIDLYNLAYQGGARPVREVVKEYPSACGTYAWDAIAPTQELLALARSRRIPVVYTTAETRKEADRQASAPPTATRKASTPKPTRSGRTSSPNPRT